MSDKYYSSETDDLNNVANSLISQNAEHLIKYIYANRDNTPYNTPEIRIGLSIKILVNSKQLYSPEILSSIVDDIQSLLTDEEHLKKFKTKQQRINALLQELSLINKLLDFDDTISLNILNNKVEYINL